MLQFCPDIIAYNKALEMDSKEINGSNPSNWLEILKTIMVMGSSLAIGESMRDALVQTVRWGLEMENKSSNLGPGSSWIIFAILVVICIPSILMMDCFIQRGQKYINMARTRTFEKT